MRRVKRYLDSRSTDSHERWLVSYADFITLLFAFFVVMYALSTVNEGKYRQMGQAIGVAFVGAGAGAPAVIPTLAMQRKAAARAEANAARRQARERERFGEAERAISAALASQVAEGLARLVSGGRGVSIELSAELLFAPGQAVLQERALALLLTLAARLRDGDQPIEIEGHTDDAPLRSAQFPSNWELSAARAAAVVRALVDAGVAPGRLAVLGYGEFRPAESNLTPEGRMRNRRVCLTLVLAQGAYAGGVAQTFTPTEFAVRPK